MSVKNTKIAGQLLLVISAGSVLALAGMLAMRARQATFTTHERWASRVGEMVVAERQTLAQRVNQFPTDPKEIFSTVVQANPYLSAVVVTDVKPRGESKRWVRPGSRMRVEPLDPRLGVLQLKARTDRKTLLGPVIMFEGEPYSTVVRPLEGNWVLVAFVRARGIQEILAQQSSLWRVESTAYDFEEHWIFSSTKDSLVSRLGRQSFQKVKTGYPKGYLHGPGLDRFRWIVSYHYRQESDLILTVGEPAYNVAVPLGAFVLCFIGALLLAGLPWIARDRIRQRQWSHDLNQFAQRVDNFVHGRDVKLNEPPYPFSELKPIVLSLRWLMPQWKKAEAFPSELALERKLLNLLIESLPEGILFFNEKGALQMGNELGRVFLQLQQEAGREYKVISGTQIPRGFLEPFAEPVFTGEQKNVGKEVEVSWADGKHLYRVWVESIEESENKVAGFIVVVRDITFRRQWEYLQEQVLSGITHDLRGPLSAVMGYLDLIRRQLKDGPAKALEYIQMARDAGVRLTQMVSDILDVVRFEQGKIDLAPEGIPLANIFLRLRNIFAVTAEQKKITLRFLSDLEQTAVVWADPKLIERIFDNLVGNAIKFTPSDGVITVTAQRGNGRMIFSIADTGRGIPREAQSRIFDKFQQVRPGDRSSGYGLGLAVVKFIVEAHKGEIRVESEVGKGSKFTFWIPDRPATVSTENQASAKA